MAKEVKAKYDYNSGHEDDLSFAAGQMITILEEVDDEWYNGEYQDTLGKRHQGMFPRNFVVLAPPQTVVPRLASIAKQEAAKDPVIKSKTPESAGSPNPSVKQAPVTATSTSGKSVTSPPTSGVSLKSVGGIHTRETLASHQPDLSKQSSPSLIQSEKPSSFRDRIAAFNKATDAPLAPRALPKPTSFVRKPFIPPPPSKESYFTLPKPTPPSKPTQLPPTTRHREPNEDLGKPTEDEPPAEPEIGKETMKERILAIQKGLVYTTKPPAPPAPPARRAESQELDESQSLSLEHGMEPSTEGETESRQESSPEDISEYVEENQDISEVSPPLKAVEPEGLGETSKTKTLDEPDTPEIDPEVARRIAIRERMAKMSGGMGMHMGMGMRPPPAFSKSTAAAKLTSSPPTSPPSERRDPIPIIPGFPALKPRQPEIETQAVALDETSAGVITSSDKLPPVNQATKSTPEKEEIVSLAHETDSDVEQDDDDPHNSSDEAEVFHGEQDTFGMHQDKLSEEEECSDDDYPTSPRPPIAEESRRSNSTSVPPTSPDKRLHSLQIGGETPPLISSRPAPTDTPPRASRPPPPPPPIPSVFHPSPPPIPLSLKFEPLAEPESPSEQPAHKDSDGDDSSIASEDIKNDAYGSPRSPISRPPPPPPPAPSLPPKSPPTSSSRAPSIPPIPPTPRHFESEHRFDEKPPSVPSIPAPAPAHFEQYRSTDIYADNPRYHSPTSPTSTPFRRTQSERPSLDSSRGRSSMEPHRQEGSHFSMKEENIQDGRQWWLDPVSPPFAFRNRKDLTYEVEDSTSTRRGGHTSVTREVYVIFSDYSQTIITAQYDRDEPSRATISQRHLPPPPPPSKAELESRHEQIGHQVVALAQGRLGASVGDGSSLAFIQEIFSKLENCLPSAGARSHGALIYSNFGNSSTQQFDEIRPGDIVAFRNATFQAHGGLRGKVITEVGKPDHVAVIHEWNGSKKKLKVLEQRQETRRVAHNSYKIGDLKSGEVHIFRPMPRSWVDW